VWQDGVAEPKLSTTFEDFEPGAPMHVHQGFAAQARAFIDAVQSKTPPHNSFHDAVKTMELADRVLAERQS
jgi:predicted dehydrogenase